MNDLDIMKAPDVPYITHEAAQARLERTIKRFWILCIILFVSLMVTNGMWLYYEMQFEEISTTVTQETMSESGNAILYGQNAGAVIYGEGETDSNYKKKGS